MLNDFIGVCKRASSIHRFLHYVFFLCVSVGSQSFAEAATLPERHGTFEKIGFDLAWATSIRSGIFSFLEEHCPNGLCNVVEFFPTVAPESKAVTQKQPEKKSEEADEIWLHLFSFPAVSFLIGIWMGRGFGEAHGRKPNRRRGFIAQRPVKRVRPFPLPTVLIGRVKGIFWELLPKRTADLELQQAVYS